MQLEKWGNSLAVRLPAVLVQALDLHEGDEIELHAVACRNFEVERRPDTKELLLRLRKLRGSLPADFHFDRLVANSRKESN